MDGRIVILSDTHLGRPHAAARSADALRPLWRGAAHLIINGDVAEMHHPKRLSHAARQTMRLFELCEEDGVQLTLLSGNHDPYLTDLRHLHLAAGDVFVTHGDVLHKAVAPWSPAAGRMRQVHEQALASLAGEHRDDLELRLAASQHASIAEWEQMEREAARSSITGMLFRPWAVAQVLWYWWRIPKVAAQFLRRHAPQARYMILGHTHRAGVWKIDGRTIINTGSYGFPGRPLAVALEDDQLSVWRIRLLEDRYRLADQPLAYFALRSTALAAAPASRETHDPPDERPAAA